MTTDQYSRLIADQHDLSRVISVLHNGLWILSNLLNVRYIGERRNLGAVDIMQTILKCGNDRQPGNALDSPDDHTIQCQAGVSW